jgi:hypothetical protein
MLKKQYLGYALIAGGAVIGALVILLFFITQGERLILSIILVASMVAVVFGSILVFTRILDRHVQKVIEDFNADVGEEIDDFLAGKRTNVQTMFILTILITLAILFLIMKLHKFEATWGGLSVVLCGLVLSGIVALVIRKTTWFQDQHLPTPLGVFFIPVVALVVSLWLGLQTEDLRNLGLDASGAVAYNTFKPTGFDLFDFGSSSGISFNCSGDGCGELMLVVALIVLALVLVIGSAFIPQFWVVSAFVLVTVMMIITIHEFRIRRKLLIIQAGHSLVGTTADGDSKVAHLKGDPKIPVSRENK